jgi:hypothetical protein
MPRRSDYPYYDGPNPTKKQMNQLINTYKRVLQDTWPQSWRKIFENDRFEHPFEHSYLPHARMIEYENASPAERYCIHMLMRTDRAVAYLTQDWGFYDKRYPGARQS